MSNTTTQQNSEPAKSAITNNSRHLAAQNGARVTKLSPSKLNRRKFYGNFKRVRRNSPGHTRSQQTAQKCMQIHTGKSEEWGSIDAMTNTRMLIELYLPQCATSADKERARGGGGLVSSSLPSQYLSGVKYSGILWKKISRDKLVVPETETKKTKNGTTFSSSYVKSPMKNTYPQTPKSGAGWNIHILKPETVVQVTFSRLCFAYYSPI